LTCWTVDVCCFGIADIVN
jgi:hypothetical protein